jgi:multicomponent Na+:H+ antiporter subunit E
LNLAALIIGLALVWSASTGNLTAPNLLFGAGIAAIALLLIRDRLQGLSVLHRTGKLLSLALIFLVELFVGAIRVGLLVLRPNLRSLRPAIIAYPLKLTRDAEITLLANMITLTPGTLTVDVSDDRSTLYVHAIDTPDREAVTHSIYSAFERRIMGVFG